MTEKEKPNLLLQMSPEPFSGPAAPDSCGTQQRHGLLGEPGEGSLGASWATTWQTSILNGLVNLQPYNPASRVDGGNGSPANTGMVLPVLVLAECPAVPGINFH